MLLSIDEALQRILTSTPLLPKETVTLLDAHRRILREEVLAPHDAPAFPNSAMDGYAVRSADTQSASPEQPVALQVTQEIPASHWPTQVVGAGEAARIFTGAPIPEGSDAVEMQENIRREGDTAWLTQPVPPQKSIRDQGSYVREGDVVLREGDALQAGDIGLLASIGRVALQVTRRPRVAIVSCGDELVEVDGTPRPGQILESNRYSLACQVREAGGDPVLFPLVSDRPDELVAALADGLQADMLVTSGGASVGDYDLIQPTLRSLGVEIDFWKVAIKPGKPLLFGTRDRCLVFGLPGNPVSSLVTFEMFVRPAIRKMLGHAALHRPIVRAELLAPARPARGRTHVVRGSLSWEGETPKFSPFSDQGSGNPLSMRQVEALGILPPGQETLAPPASLRVMLLSPGHRSAGSKK